RIHAALPRSREIGRHVGGRGAYTDLFIGALCGFAGFGHAPLFFEARLLGTLLLGEASIFLVLLTLRLQLLPGLRDWIARDRRGGGVERSFRCRRYRSKGWNSCSRTCNSDSIAAVSCQKPREPRSR